MEENMAKAAVLACEAGFEAIDLKLCHQYLMKEFLCAYTRPGRYGGCQENRFRFALEAIDRIRSLVGTRIDITARLNAYDGIPWPYGWGMKKAVAPGTTGMAGAACTVGPMEPDPTEILELIRQLYRRGVRIFNLSTTSPRLAPTGNGYMDNFDSSAVCDPIRGAYSLLKITGQIRQALPRDIVVVGTGLAWFGAFGPAVAAGCIEKGWFDVAGFGRNILADKAFLPRLLASDPTTIKGTGINGTGCDDLVPVWSNASGLPAPTPITGNDFAERIDRSKLCVGCDSCFRLFFAGLPTGCPVHRKAYQDLYRTLNNTGEVPIF
jgi:2,4-dienoyl-CoA reductase-like NADH-dependent reductase (Old Yellow Enzyme family)